MNTEILPFTDMGNAERFSRQHKTDCRYCHEMKSWLTWNDERWIINDRSSLLTMAKSTVRSIIEEIRYAEDAKLIEQIIAHAKKSESFSKLKAMLKLAAMDADLQVASADLDADPLLLHCSNGVIDLRSGELMPFDRAHFITKTTGIQYDPSAKYPLWLEFLNTVTNGNKSLINYLQKIFGYSLTGIINEQVLFLLIGYGCNGKSTLLECVRKILGDYAKHMPAATLLNNNTANIRSDIARLNGARMVTAVEIGDGKRLDEALVKQLTGGDRVTSRFLYRDYFEHSPTYKIFIAANYPPEIKGVDEGIWRRIRLIPFSVTIPDDKIDKDLSKKLDNELPGILTWCVQGCIKWQSEGLGMPLEVKEAISHYRNEEDHIKQFIDDHYSHHKSCRVSIKSFYENYEAWCLENGEDPKKKKTVGMMMKQKGYKSSKSGSVRFWEDLKIKK